MAKRANPTLIGGFVVGAVLLAVAGLIVLGGGRFFRVTKPMVAYFEGSVKGLSIGAPVTFQGVRVGTVTDVRAVIDTNDLRITTPVFFEIDASHLTEANGTRLTLQKTSEGARKLIQRGLRAELEVQSFVTGQVGIALSFQPDTPVRLTGLSPEYLEMPTVTSGIAKLTQTLETLPMKEIATAAKETIEGIQALVQSPETRATLRSLMAASGRSEETLRAIQKLAQRVEAEIDPLMTRIDATAKSASGALDAAQTTLVRLTPRVDESLKDYQTLAKNLDQKLDRLSESLNRTLASVDRTLGGADDVMGDDSEVRVSLVVALDELAEAAQSIRVLADSLERNPSSLVFGKGRVQK